MKAAPVPGVGAIQRSGQIALEIPKEAPVHPRPTLPAAPDRADGEARAPNRPRNTPDDEHEAVMSDPEDEEEVEESDADAEAEDAERKEEGSRSPLPGLPPDLLLAPLLPAAPRTPRAEDGAGQQIGPERTPHDRVVIALNDQRARLASPAQMRVFTVERGEQSRAEQEEESGARREERKKEKRKTFPAQGRRREETTTRTTTTRRSRAAAAAAFD